MKERDARGLSQATQAELRRSAVRMRKAGKSRSEVGLALGVHVKTITRWTGAHKKHGSAIFAPRKRGRRTGEQRDLSPEQEGALQKMIAEKTPDQLKRIRPTKPSRRAVGWVRSWGDETTIFPAR